MFKGPLAVKSVDPQLHHIMTEDNGCERPPPPGLNEGSLLGTGSGCYDVVRATNELAVEKRDGTCKSCHIG